MPEARRARRRGALLALTLALLAPAAASAQDGAPAPPVVVVNAQLRTLAPKAWYPAAVISRLDARVASEVDGRVVAVADVGTEVAAGEPVARLDRTLIEQTLEETEAVVAREQARIAYLEQEVARLRRLADRNNVAQSQLDEAIANRGVSHGELAAARARVEHARERLERTVIRAPFSGVVTERAVQVGEWAESGDTVVRLVDTEALEVQTRVPAHTLAFLRKGAGLTMQASPERATGTVRTIVPVGDDQSRLYELRVSLDGAPWPPGQTLRIAIPTAPAREVVAVPRDALILRRDGVVVYRVLDDGTADRVVVETGIADGPLIEVRGAIAAGDRVVVRGGERLRPGQPVRIVPRSGAS